VHEVRQHFGRSSGEHDASCEMLNSTDKNGTKPRVDRDGRAENGSDNRNEGEREQSQLCNLQRFF